MGARAARADNHGVERHAHVEPLLLHLLHAGDVAQAADRVRAAARDDVALAAERGELLGDFRHRGTHVGAARHDGDGLDAHQLEHEVVAAGFLLVAVRYALLDHEAGLQPLLDRGGQRNSAMVGLRRTAGDQRIGALRQRIGRQELELARLVAAREQAEHVVALDPDGGADAARAGLRQSLGEVRQELDRGGERGVATTRKTGQIHCDQTPAISTALRPVCGVDDASSSTRSRSEESDRRRAFRLWITLVLRVPLWALAPLFRVRIAREWQKPLPIIGVGRRTRVERTRMSKTIEIPDWLLRESPPSPPPSPVDDHRVEGLVNGFIAGKQDALFEAPDAYYRTEGADAVDGAPAITQRLQDLRLATLDLARDDGERAALAPRLDAHLDEAMDGIGRHVAQQTVRQRQIIATRQALIQRAAELEHDNDDKIAGLAEAHASAAQALAQLSGVEPGSDDEADVLNAARSQILRTAIEQRIANAKGAQAINLHDRMQNALTPDDRHALALPIAATRDDTATDAWLARQDVTDGPPLIERVESDDTLPDTQRLILRAKIGARDSAAESSRVATVKGLDDQLAAATKAIATQPSQYRIGTLNALAQAYADAREPDKAAD